MSTSTAKGAAKGTKPRARRTTRSDAVSELANAIAQMRPTAVMGEPMVGIRNISNYTIGLTSPYQDEPPVQLSGPRYADDDPTREVPDATMSAVISHKWWRALLREAQVRKGMIVRDDSILSADTLRAPADEPKDLPSEWAVNAIPDPHAWIQSKEEDELLAALDRLTAEEAMRRLLTAVNQRIEYERLKLRPQEREFTPEDFETRALRNLPWRYKRVEEVVLERLEQDFYGPDARAGF